LRKVGGLFPNASYNVSGFSLPPTITDRHHITEKMLSMAKNTKQTNKQTNKQNNYAGKVLERIFK
jgi:hypothetical protein